MLADNIVIAGLDKMYTADECFRENIDKHGEGTAEFFPSNQSILQLKAQNVGKRFN